MGEILQQMLGFLLITLLLAFCDSFPQINDHNLRSTDKKEKLMIEEVISEVGEKIAGINEKENDAILLDSPGNNELIGAKTHGEKTVLQNKEKLFRTVRQFTENSIANMLKIYLIRRRKQHKTNMKNLNVILEEPSTIQKMQNNITADNAIAKPSATKLSDVSKKSIDVKDIDKIKMPAPAKSKVNRWLPGLLNYRRRRSFLSDFGFQLESAFEGDTSEVVFGAHTSPCDYEDRHYCLNGGTCIFLGALEMKTCRCKIGYTGLRCQMINQEFLLALLSDEFFG